MATLYENDAGRVTEGKVRGKKSLIADARGASQRDERI